MFSQPCGKRRSPGPEACANVGSGRGWSKRKWAEFARRTGQVPSLSRTPQRSPSPLWGRVGGGQSPHPRSASPSRPSPSRGGRGTVFWMCECVSRGGVRCARLAPRRLLVLRSAPGGARGTPGDWPLPRRCGQKVKDHINLVLTSGKPSPGIPRAVCEACCRRPLEDSGLFSSIGGLIDLRVPLARVPHQVTKGGLAPPQGGAGPSALGLRPGLANPNRPPHSRSTQTTPRESALRDRKYAQQNTL